MAVRSVLVVVPTLNEAPNIARVLDELAISPPEDCLIDYVVADGGSVDGTVQIVEAIASSRPEVSLLPNPVRLQSAAVNLAVERFGADRQLLVRCDAHAHYPPGFIRDLIAAMDNSDADAVVVPMDSEGEGCFQKAVAWVSDSKVGSGGSAHRGGRVSGFVDHGHHALFRIESFREAGGYDPSFTHNEDAELDCRQRAKGRRIFLDGNIRLRYAPRATAGKLARQYFNYGKGRSRTVRRHPSSLRMRQLAIPAHVGFSIVSLLLALWQPIFLAWPLIYTLILAATSVSIALKKQSACGLLAGFAAAIMHFAWGLGFMWGWASISEKRWSGAD